MKKQNSKKDKSMKEKMKSKDYIFCTKEAKILTNLIFNTLKLKMKSKSKVLRIKLNS